MQKKLQSAVYIYRLSFILKCKKMDWLSMILKDKEDNYLIRLNIMISFMHILRYSTVHVFMYTVQRMQRLLLRLQSSLYRLFVLFDRVASLIRTFKLWILPDKMVIGKRNWVFATNSDYLIPISLKTNGVDLRYFKLNFFRSNNLSLK